MAPRLTKGAHFSIVIALYILLLDYHSGQSAPTRVTRWTGSESLALLKTASSFIDPQIANLPNAAVGSILPTNEKRKKKREHIYAAFSSALGASFCDSALVRCGSCCALRSSMKSSFLRSGRKRSMRFHVSTQSCSCSGFWLGGTK